MNYDMIERIQITLFFLCIGSLIFIIVRSRKREVRDIGNIDKENLKNAIPKQASEEVVNGVKKRRWITILLAFLGIMTIDSIFGHEIEELFYSWYTGMKDVQLSDFGIEGVIVILLSHASIILIGVLLIGIWVIYDIYKTKKVEDKVIIPAYVQSVFVNPQHKTKTVQLIYYDYKKEKFRLKTVSVDEYEVEHGHLFRRDKVSIVATEKKNRVTFLALYEG